MRYQIKVPAGDPRYEMDLDLRERALHVFLGEGDVEEQIESADGLSCVDFRIHGDDFPIVLGVSIFDPNKVSIIQDWIEDAVMDAMANLNAHHIDERGNAYTDNYEDNCWRPVLLAPRAGTVFADDDNE